MSWHVMQGGSSCGATSALCAPQCHVAASEVPAACSIPLSRQCNVILRRREAGDTGSLRRARVSGICTDSSGCCSVVQGQSTKIFPKQPEVSALCPGGVREWQMEKTKLAKCVSQSWQQYSANRGTTMMESQIALPVQPGFRNFGVVVRLERAPVPSAGSYGLAFGIFRCF